MDLLAFERKLDQTIARKRMEIQEAIKKPLTVRGSPGEQLGGVGAYKVGAAVDAASLPLTLSIPSFSFPVPQQKRKLRIYISNTFTPAKEEGEGGERVASWELRVEGKLLEDVRMRAGLNWLWEEHWCSVLRAWLGWTWPSAHWVLEAVFGLGPSMAGGVRLSFSCSVLQPSKQKRKFSSFFKSLVIELDKELYGPDNHLVEVRWEAPGHAAGLAPHPGRVGRAVTPRRQWEVVLPLTLQALSSPAQRLSHCKRGLSKVLWVPRLGAESSPGDGAAVLSGLKFTAAFSSLVLAGGHSALNPLMPANTQLELRGVGPQ